MDTEKTSNVIDPSGGGKTKLMLLGCSLASCIQTAVRNFQTFVLAAPITTTGKPFAMKIH